MFSFLHRKSKPSMPATSPEGYLLPQPAKVLLDPPRRQQLLDNIWQRASLSRQQFSVFYRQPLERFAELVQQFPASENHHHAHLGGLLDHGLEIVAYALKIRQTYLLPIGAPPESQSAQAEAWTAAAAYGALTHDLGKIAVDIQVELEGGKPWHPWHGPIERPYRFRYLKGRQYPLHGAAASLIHAQVLSAELLDWLSGFPELWPQWVFLLAGQYEHAGLLGEIVIKADQASVAQALGGNPARALAAPKHTLQRQLADALRHLVRDRYKLNQPEASDGWLTQDALWLTCLPLSEALRAHLLSQGVSGVPSSNPAVFNLLQDQGLVQTNAQGKAVWRASLDNGKGWRKTLTLLKLSPALIWGDPNDRPAPYTGTLTVDEGAVIEPEEETQRQSSAPAAPMATKPRLPANEPARPLPPLPAHTPSSQEETEILAMLAGLDTPISKSVIAATDAGDSTPGPQQSPYKSDVSISGQAVAETGNDHKDAIGPAFVDWLRQGIRSHKLIINDAKALVHTVDGTAMLVTPGIFRRYVQEFPEVQHQAKARELEPWQLVQRCFEKLKLHRKTDESLNIWTLVVSGPRKVKALRGYLLRDPHTLFAEPPLDNPSLHLKSATPGEGPA
nr:MobH family relaxase [Pseudomonas protegens]